MCFKETLRPAECCYVGPKSGGTARKLTLCFNCGIHSNVSPNVMLLRSRELSIALHVTLKSVVRRIGDAGGAQYA